MKRYWPIILVGVLVSVTLTGCLGMIRNRVEQSERGLAEANFDRYSDYAAVEYGLSTVEINNELADEVSIKLSVVDHEEGWKIFELAGHGSLTLELGAIDYLLEVETKDGDRDQLFISPGDTTVRITDEWFYF